LGQTKFNGTCAGCHTTTVASNVLNVTKAATSSGIAAAMTKGAHAGFASTLTAQDLLNLSAYVNSAK
jgi:mono/diheme cytochrome c family protein